MTKPEQRVAIVVDSAASLPSYCDQLSGPHVVPVQLSIDGKSYLDGQDLTTGDFYRLLRRSKQPLSTASPAPGSFLSAFESAAAEARSILCVELFVSEFSPALGAHTGPGLLGVAFWAEDTPPGIGRAAK